MAWVGVRGQCGIPTYPRALNVRRGSVGRLLRATRGVEARTRKLKKGLQEERRRLGEHREVFLYLAYLRRLREKTMVEGVMASFRRALEACCDHMEEGEAEVVHHTSTGNFLTAVKVRQVVEARTRALTSREGQWGECLTLIRHNYRWVARPFPVPIWEEEEEEEEAPIVCGFGLPPPLPPCWS